MSLNTINAKMKNSKVIKGCRKHSRTHFKAHKFVHKSAKQILIKF